LGLKDKVAKRVADWESYGWVVDAPPDCKWNTPLLAAHKAGKDGAPDDVRVCLDARALNALIIDEVDSHLPDIKEVMHSVAGSEWFTALDQADMFNQFPIKPEDRPKTAFTLNGRHMMFTRAIYGIKTIPAHTQRLMELLLGPLGCIPFQDDANVGSKDVAQHKKQVLEILEKITYDANLRLRLTKCKFFKRELRILGFIVNKDGVKMDPRKTKAIIDWPRPVDGKAMQRFLGAANFHRNFSKDYATITAPMEACRNIVGKINWTDELVASFEKLKELFAADIQLRHIDESKTMYLTTDVSLVGAGAWLGQKDDTGVIMPCYCVSKKLTATQQCWSTTKRELWVLMWAMQKLRYFLLGKQFTARVDHKPLVAML
jgi:hypothetical protein